MECITFFAHTGVISVTEKNVKELMLAADMLLVEAITKACQDFLVERLGPENCIGIWQFTRTMLTFSRLQLQAFIYIIDHFEEVISHKEFQKLSWQELSDILSRDDLNVKKESTACKAVIDWVYYELESRKGHLSALLPKIRLSLISPNILALKHSKLVWNDPDCMTLLKKVEPLYDHCTVTDLCKPYSRPRIPRLLLLAVGGWSPIVQLSSIEAYDICSDCWTYLTSTLRYPLAGHGLALFNDRLYCMGGFNGKENLKSTYRFNPSTSTWHKVHSMHTRRSRASVAVLDGYLYVIGGRNTRTIYSSVERYRQETNQWNLISPMNHARCHAGCTTLNGKIYICGGYDGISALDTCECYDPEINQWTLISRMRTARSGVGIIAYAGCIFAVGGILGKTRLCSAEAYDPETNTWHAISSMRNPRSHFGIEMIGNKLFVVGGCNGYGKTAQVEYYNMLTNSWSVACNMNIPRSALKCCLVDKSPYMARYAEPCDASV